MPRQDRSQTSAHLARPDGGLRDPHLSQILIFGRPLFLRSVARQQNNSTGTRTRRRSTRPPSSRASRQLFSGTGASDGTMDEVDLGEPRGMGQSIPLQHLRGQGDAMAPEEDYQSEPPHYTETPQPQQQGNRQSSCHCHRRASLPDPGFTYISHPSSSSSPDSSVARSSEDQESFQMRKRDRIAAKVYGVLGLGKKSSYVEEEDDLESYSEENSSEQIWERTASMISLEDLTTPAPAQTQTRRAANVRNDDRPNTQTWSEATTPQSSIVNSVASSIFPNVSGYVHNSDTSRPSTSGTSGHQSGRQTSPGGAKTQQRASRGRSQQQQERRHHHQQPQSRQSHQEQQPQAQQQQRLPETHHLLQRELPPPPEPHTQSQTRPPLQQQPHIQRKPLPPKHAETTSRSDCGEQDTALANNAVAADSNIPKDQEEEDSEVVVTDISIHNSETDEVETVKEWNMRQISTLIVVPAIVAFVASRLQQAS